jgi:anti-sigma regulatory factor (Ser/Thr protein kinase)
MPDADVSPVAQIELRFPGSPEYLRLARLTAADAGTRVGLDYDEVEDLRIAVSELCAMVASGGAEVTLRFTLGPGSVTVAGHGPGVPEAKGSEMARALVAAVVDDQHIEIGGRGTAFRITKAHHHDEASR